LINQSINQSIVTIIIMSNPNSNNKIPAVITTAHLLLRGLLPAFLGCSIDAADSDGGRGVQASAFQMTYRKDLPKLGAAAGELVS